MAYNRYFETGVTRSGLRYVARYDGEYVGTFTTWAEANAALKAYSRRDNPEGVCMGAGCTEPVTETGHYCPACTADFI